MENILLDIKMNQEQQPLHILPPIPHDVSFHQTVLQEQQEEEEEETPFEVVENGSSEEVVPDEEEYTELLNQVHDEVKSEEVLPVITNTNPTNKYDSMTKDELVELVKKRGLRAGNRPGREKLISILEKADESTVTIEGGSFNDLQEAVSE